MDYIFVSTNLCFVSEESSIVQLNNAFLLE